MEWRENGRNLLVGREREGGREGGKEKRELLVKFHYIVT